MRIERRNLSELHLDPDNVNTHGDRNLAAIRDSVGAFGQQQLIVVDEAGKVIGGNGTVTQMLELGIDEADCQVFEGTDAEARALAIALNRSASLAEMNEAALAAALTELPDDLQSAAGYTDEEVAALLELCSEPPVITEDEPPEPPDDPRTELGRIYQLGRHRLLCGDSTDADKVKILMSGEKADMVFTDPPYGVDYDGINNDSRDGLAELLNGAFLNYKENCKDGASIYCFHSDRCADIFHEVFRAYCHFSSMCIWVKPALVLSQTDYHSRHEPFMYGWFDNGTHLWHSDRKQDSIWEYGKESVDGHTTPKPTELVANAIENSSKQGGQVLDLFGGSGTTLIACEQTNRSCYMMELDPKYCDVIVERYCKLTEQDADAVFETGVAK